MSFEGGEATAGPTGEMPVARLVELLQGAGGSWRTAQGVARHWSRHDLVTRAFERHFEQVSRNAPLGSVAFVSATAEDPAVPDDVEIEEVRPLAADRPMRRRRAELLSARSPGPLAEVLVIDGDTFWARNGGELRTNGGDPNSSHGGAEIVDMLLCPGYVPALFSLTALGYTEAAGRTCIEAAARPRTDLTEIERDDELWEWPAEPFDMVTGGDEYLLAVDTQTGVIVRASKFVDGHLAEVTEWQQLHLDPVLPESLFAALH